MEYLDGGETVENQGNINRKTVGRRNKFSSLLRSDNGMILGWVTTSRDLVGLNPCRFTFAQR